MPEGYAETHHVLPRCMGGGDEFTNLVELPPRYHFVAHLLLARIYGGKLVHAAWMMSNEGKYNSRKYQWLRKAFAASMKGNQINKGRKHSLETRAKVSAASKKRGVTSEMAKKSWDTRRKNGTDKHSPEAIANIKAAHADMKGSNNPMFGRKHSPETRAKMALKASARMQGEKNTWFGKKHSDETKAKIGAKSTERLRGNQHTKGMRFKTIDGKRVRIL